LPGLPGSTGRTSGGTAVGVNHLTWFTELRYKGTDAWPLDGAPQVEDSPFSWELFELYGAFPAVFDRHVTEFFPSLCREGAYYGKTLGVEAFSFEGTIERGDRGFERMREMAQGDENLPDHFMSGGSGEHGQLTDILMSLWTDRQRVYSVNLPNGGQVENLPDGAVLESPALVDGGGFHPIAVGNLSEGIASTLVKRITSTELTVDAALSGSLDLFIQALLADGAVTLPSEARALAIALLKAQAEHLPQFETASLP
jgi:alpha-galactosidase